MSLREKLRRAFASATAAAVGPEADGATRGGLRFQLQRRYARAVQRATVSLPEG